MTTDQNIIENCNALDAIKRRYGPRYFASAEATEAAAALWGATTNDCGVIQDIVETIHVEQGRCRATVTLYRTAKGNWFYGCDLTLPLSGFGFAASVWDRQAYTNEMAARQHALDLIIRRIGPKSENPSGQSEHTAFLQKLESAKAKQLCLF